DIGAVFVKPLGVKTLVVHDQAGTAGGDEVIIETRCRGGEYERAGLEPILVEVRKALRSILGSRGTSDEDIGILDSLLLSFHDGEFDTWMGFTQVGCGALRGFWGAAFNLDALDRWALGNRGSQDG